MDSFDYSLTLEITVARQKAKELYKQLKTKNMAKVNDFGNG
jgi:hypothetical protein